MKALSRRTVNHIAAGSEFSVIIDADEQVLAWGCADGGLVSFFCFEACNDWLVGTEILRPAQKLFFMTILRFD